MSSHLARPSLVDPSYGINMVGLCPPLLPNRPLVSSDLPSCHASGKQPADRLDEPQQAWPPDKSGSRNGTSFSDNLAGVGDLNSPSPKNLRSLVSDAEIGTTSSGGSDNCLESGGPEVYSSDLSNRVETDSAASSGLSPDFRSSEGAATPQTLPSTSVYCSVDEKAALSRDVLTPGYAPTMDMRGLDDQLMSLVRVMQALATRCRGLAHLRLQQQHQQQHQQQQYIYREAYQASCEPLHVARSGLVQTSEEKKKCDARGESRRTPEAEESPDSHKGQGPRQEEALVGTGDGGGSEWAEGIDNVCDNKTERPVVGDIPSGPGNDLILILIASTHFLSKPSRASLANGGRRRY
ncbi:unnamed protein product [Protopolystoma xenopodis]|uniref:Uncharacterized protein n=1 Tax=Protopolystoma xenopodis TaxID=117903 RepID=A0A3S5FDQ0_9PLAT|nr:unnamed protein product [Protopolystoma xenopodis]